jgi:hypothetical protein
MKELGLLQQGLNRILKVLEKGSQIILFHLASNSGGLSDRTLFISVQ